MAPLSIHDSTCFELMEKMSLCGGDGGAPSRIAGMAVPGMAMPTFSGPVFNFCLPTSCDVDELLSPSSEECEAYALYLRLTELSHLQKIRSWPGWSNESLVRPALHSLEMVFRLISSTLCDPRNYIDKEEWLRRLEALANSQIELISLITEGDHNAPTKKQQSMAIGSSSTASQGGGQSLQQKTPGSKSHSSVKSISSRESLLPRMATWKKAQSTVTRLQFVIEGHMLRVPFTLGLGEPNLSGKPVLDYDRVCTPSEVYACQQATPGSPEDHALASAHQIMEAWLVVAQGLVKSVEEKVESGDSEGAANRCWILERVWKLFTSTMDLLQVMDPDDFMKLKQKLDIKPKSGGSRRSFSAGHGCGAAAFCLRSTMLRTVTKACKELRSLVPKVVGVEVDPKGGPRLQEAVMELFNSHGQRTRGYPYGRPEAYHSGTIHLLQAFQSIEVAIRQFYFTYRHLVITVMGSGEYTGAIQPEISGADALLQLYSEPPYFPSVDGARTFLGNFWHPDTAMEESGITNKQVASERASKCSSLGRSSGDDSEDNMLCNGSSSICTHAAAPHPPANVRVQRQLLDETSKSTQQQQSQLHNFSIGA